jgi:exosortase A-associated hydrolase 1
MARNEPTTKLTQMTDGCRERLVTFDCDDDECLGVLSMPGEAAPASIGVLIIVGGPQTRVGSHRQFTLLARALATAGYPTLRFDYRGMGDSAGSARTFESVRNDIIIAIDVLQREAALDRIVLWGLCDAASAAWMDGCDDPRIAGIVALNPWARSPQGQAVTQLRHYYVRRLLDPGFWRKVLSGNFRFRQRAQELAGAVHSATKAPGPGSAYLQRMEDGWRRCIVPILIVLSGNDYTAREFEGWVGANLARTALMCREGTAVLRLPEADHTFSSRKQRDRVADMTIEWLTNVAQRRVVR